MSSTTPLEPGIYRHYKGNQYEVVGVGKDTETEEDVVIYRPLYESDVAYWVRPYKIFTDLVEKNGHKVPRFRRATSDE